jgi:ankyrin repeat protein
LLEHRRLTTGIVTRNASGKTPLDIACAENEAGMVRLIATAARKKSAIRFDVNPGDGDDRPSLILAVQSGSHDAVAALLVFVDLSIEDASKSTALHWAIDDDDSRMVDILVEKGNVSAKLRTEIVAYARKKGRIDLARKLIE